MKKMQGNELIEWAAETGFDGTHALDKSLIAALRAEITRLEPLISAPRETTKEGELGFCDKLQGADMPHHRSKLCLNFRPAPLSAGSEE